jgi:hypothetical protein
VVLFNFISGFKIPGKTLLNGIVNYTEKDLNNRYSTFENLIETVDFKKIEKVFFFNI